jgi:hypothetical protein
VVSLYRVRRFRPQPIPAWAPSPNQSYEIYAGLIRQEQVGIRA